MPQDFNTPNTATTLSTSPLGDPRNVRTLWKQGAMFAEANGDFLQQMEGSGPKSLIWTQTDLSKGNGSKMVFTTQSGFYKKPKLGDAQFEGPTDYDKIRQGAFELKVDFARWAVRNNIRTEEIMGMRGDILSGVNVQLGETLGRFKSEQGFGLFFHKLPVANVVYAGGKSRDTLKSADIFRWDEVVSTGQAMLTLGGLPADVRGKNAGGSEIWSQTFIAPTPACTSLKLDSGYRDVLKHADIKGMNNTIFKGGYPSMDGHTIVPYDAIDHDGVGPMGSFMNPKAYVGNAAITAGTTALTVYGGGNGTDFAEIDFFRYFANSPYDYIDTGAITPATDVSYFIIYNITGANAGKWGMYAYTVGNNGTNITCTARLAAAASGTAHTILGGLGNTNGLGGTYTASGASAAGTQWNAAINIDSHPLGSLIIPCNALGVPIVDVLAMGRSAIVRGYGMFRGEHTSDSLQGGFVKDRYLTSVFGQSFKLDRLNRVTSAMRLTVAATYPGVNLPVRS